MDQPVLAARVRKSKGKGAARKLRMSNQIPAIFYGPKTEPIMLAVDYPELERILSQGTGDNVILDLQMQSDHGTEIRRVIVKDLLINPVRMPWNWMFLALTSEIRCISKTSNFLKGSSQKRKGVRQYAAPTVVAEEAEEEVIEEEAVEEEKAESETEKESSDES
jgi:ribosomal protein L25 (general stress protein Ctc)